ncbi:MAG: CDP-alcohol phosphatidyltransferase family protein [Nitrospirae bacterium]|nr:MAG: CDP-alcohol phosphatidyltransferase family protein [Nitrospirota bacterium]
MDGTLNKPEITTVDTAIVLASCGVFDLAAPGPRTSQVLALTRVGGLTLFQRTILTLQRGGISQIFALVGEEERMLRRLIQADDRVRAAVRWLPVREFPPADPKTWEVLAGEVKGSCLILGCHMIFTPSLIELLREQGQRGQAVVVAGRPGDEGWAANPGILMRAASLNHHEVSGVTSRVVFHDLARMAETHYGQDVDCVPAGDMVVLPARLLGVSGSWKTPETGPIRLALEQAAAEGIVQILSAGGHGYVDARGENGPERAQHLLFQSLQTVKGGFDGWVDRYVNRKLSALLTRGFIWLGLSPNVVTILSMIVGLLGAWMFAAGSYQLGILGALLFQLSVIIDCCDGEVARLTFAESKFGQELDLIADNFVHMAIFAGIAWGSYNMGPWQGSSIPLLLGVLAIMGNGVSFWLVNQVRYLKARPLKWSKLPSCHRERLERILHRLANRDFSIVVILCAGLGILPWFLALSAVGSWVFAVTIGWLLRRSLRLASSSVV